MFARFSKCCSGLFRCLTCSSTNRIQPHQPPKLDLNLDALGPADVSQSNTANRNTTDGETTYNASTPEYKNYHLTVDLPADTNATLLAILPNTPEEMVSMYFPFPSANFSHAPDWEQVKDRFMNMFSKKEINGHPISRLFAKNLFLDETTYMTSLRGPRKASSNPCGYAYIEFSLPASAAAKDSIQLDMENIASIRNHYGNKVFFDENNKDLVNGRFLMDSDFSGDDRIELNLLSFSAGR